MDLDLRVKTHGSVSDRLAAAIEQAATPETHRTYDGDQFFSDAFVRRHSEFESLAEFCRACPSDRDDIGGIQRLPEDDRDAFVAATTEFETWAEMKEGSAIADLVVLNGL